MNSTTIRTGLTVLLATALTACSLGSHNRQQTLQPEPDYSTTQPIASRALLLPVPTVQEAPQGVIDLNTLGTNANVLVTYPAITNGHTVGLRWTGKATYNAPVQTVGTTRPLRFTIPKSNIAADVSSSGTLTYSVGIDNNPIETSTPLSVRVTGNTIPATYPAPIAPAAQAGKLDLATLGANITVNITYPTIVSGHTLGLRWTGKSQYDAPIQIVGTARPVVFAVPKTAVTNDLGGTGTFTYSVGIADTPLKISDPLPLAIVNTLPSGAAVAAALNSRYKDVRDLCPTNLPAYYCNGVIIRSTENGAYDPWNPSPAAIKLGGVSFTYMRTDAYVQNLYHNSGFTFLPQSEAILQGKQMVYLCIYAYDAGTLVGVRGEQGCGLKPREAQLADISTCSRVGVRTVAEWYAYTQTIPNRDYQCSLSTADPGQFAVGYKVRANRPPNMEALWNEMMVKLWAQNIPTQLPLEAFFYKNATGLSEAKIYQQKYSTRTGGKWLPVIKLDLTQLNGNPFSYNPADQAVQP